MKIGPMGEELFLADERKTDGQAHRDDEAKSPFSQFFERA
jgi:hypothetical protein